jgi:hypothetical protein
VVVVAVLQQVLEMERAAGVALLAGIELAL